jgi:hypothetical protein
MKVIPDVIPVVLTAPKSKISVVQQVQSTLGIAFVASRKTLCGPIDTYSIL